MDNLTTILRKLTGRQLTEEEMRKAKRNERVVIKNGAIDYFIRDGYFVVRTYINKEPRTTDELIQREQGQAHLFPIKGYSFSTFEKWYNPDGLLKEKRKKIARGIIF